MYTVDDDFEDLRGSQIDPETALRANRMFRRWWEAINEEMPNAFNKGDPEERDIIMMGAAALLGDCAGLIWAATHEELARKVLGTKVELAVKKMEMTAAMASKTPN